MKFSVFGVVVAAWIGGSSAALAQCADWTIGFTLPGPDWVPGPMTEFDDGSGPALFVVAYAPVDDASIQQVSAWDGHSWRDVGVSDGTTYALAPFDDGSGAALYAAGSFTSIDGVACNSVARWNGSAWSAVGAGAAESVRALTVWDDGTGAALYAGGGTDWPAHGMLIRWNGTAWSQIPLGPTYPGTGARIHALASYDDGSGSALYIAGAFGGSIAKWNGSTWSALGTGLDNFASALAVHDDGGGAQLYVVGAFDSAGGAAAGHIARWNGTQWSSMTDTSGVSGMPSNSQVDALYSFDDGTGPALYVGGLFNFAGSQYAHSLAKWSANAWSTVGGAEDLADLHHSGANVRALTSFLDPSVGARRLFVAGDFARAGDTAVRGIARRDPNGWSALGEAHAPSGAVSDACTYDDGSGRELYVCGALVNAGPHLAGHVARWNGSSWSPVGSGLGATGGPWESIETLAEFRGSLYAGGSFDTIDGASAESIARWDGAAWHPVGSGLAGGLGLQPTAVDSLVFDDGSGAALYITGIFKRAGGVLVNHVAKWDGASWSALGSGFNDAGRYLALFDDGSGVALHASGSFTAAGGVAANRVAKWNGASWSAVGSPPSAMGPMLAYDDGTGSALYGVALLGLGAPYGLVRWDGSNWSALGTGFNTNGFGNTLAAFDDGGGRALVVGGSFISIDGVAAKNVAQWRAGAWSAMQGGVDCDVRALFAVEEPSIVGPALYVGGPFRSAGGRESRNLARWGRSASCAPASYCTAGTSANGCVAHVSASGVASASSPSGFTLLASGVDGQRLGTFFYSISGVRSTPWGSGSSFVCVASPTQRTGTQSSGGAAGACNGSLTLDLNAWLAAHPSAMGAPFTVTRSSWAQAWFRDPASPKGSTLSDAIEFAVEP